MIKMILSDLDETLLVDFHVPSINRDAIAKARKKGVHFAVASGRARFMVQSILEEVGTAECEDEYSICYNGAAVYRNSDPRPLFVSPLCFEQIEAVKKISDHYGLCFLAMTLDQIWMYHPSESEVKRKTTQHARFQIETDLNVLKEDQVMKIALQSDSEEQLYAIGEEQAERFKEMGVEISYSSGRYLECTCRGVSKGSALRWLCGYLGLKQEETMTIGDNYNDIEMLKEAGLGVCVADGRDKAKNAADAVTEKGYKEGAVAEAIERFVLAKL